MYGIGLTYGIPWQNIALKNGLTAASILQIGQRLALPGTGEAAVEGESEAPRQPQQGRHEGSPEPILQTYVVQPGDSLWSIAARRGISLSDLMAQNGLTAESILYPGQILQLPPR